MNIFYWEFNAQGIYSDQRLPEIFIVKGKFEN